MSAKEVRVRAATVEIASAEELPVVRHARVRALAQDPSCFGTALAAEPSIAQWRASRFEHDWFVAWIGGELAGIAAMFFDDTTPDGAPQLGGMWVANAHRQHGVGRAVEAAAARRTVRRGFDAIGLWVVDGNWGAARAFHSYGYEITGDSKPAPRDPSVLMSRMRRAI